MTMPPTDHMPSRPAGNGLAATRDAPLLTMDDRLRAIEATGQRLAGYVQFMCQIGSLSGTSGEAKDGFLKLAAAPAIADAPALLADYLALVASFNPSGKPRIYPGSPFVTQALLRTEPRDKLWLFELHPTDSKALTGHGLVVRLLAAEARDLGLDAAAFDPPLEVIDEEGDAGHDCELALVVGGDGTILRAAEITHASGTPLLGVNLGQGWFMLVGALGDDRDDARCSSSPKNWS